MSAREELKKILNTKEVIDMISDEEFDVDNSNVKNIVETFINPNLMVYPGITDKYAVVKNVKNKGFPEIEKSIKVISNYLNVDEKKISEEWENIAEPIFVLWNDLMIPTILDKVSDETKGAIDIFGRMGGYWGVYADDIDWGLHVGKDKLKDFLFSDESFVLDNFVKHTTHKRDVSEEDYQYVLDLHNAEGRFDASDMFIDFVTKLILISEEFIDDYSVLFDISEETKEMFNKFNSLMDENIKYLESAEWIKEVMSKENLIHYLDLDIEEDNE
jgi:hypothetical protein